MKEAFVETPVGEASVGACVQSLCCGDACCPCSSPGMDKLRDLEFFQTWSQTLPHWKEHNAALKWFRAVHLFKSSFVLPDEVQKGKIQHWEGTTSSFSEETESWSWLSMIASLDEESMAKIVTNNGQSQGLVRCEFSPRPNSYDDASSRSLREAEVVVKKKVDVWDFLLIRDDGSGIRIHPEWTKTKVPTVPHHGPSSEMDTPPRGFGTSAGKGSFQRYKNHGVDGIVRFDPMKWQKTAVVATGN